MDRKASHDWRYATSFLTLAALCLVTGCSKSSLRDFSFLRSSQSDSVSFDSDVDSNSISLLVWHDSFEAAQQASAESGKPILADFTGSDWCRYCIKLKEDVFEQPEFAKWARENVVLLELDYPKRAMQSPEIKKQNSRLKDRYKIESYPTVLLLDSDGRVLGKLGYEQSPTEWIKSAETKLLESKIVLARNGLDR